MNTDTKQKQIIPDQLVKYPLIKVCQPDCKVHKNCNGGKRPVTSSANDKPQEEIANWVQNGGNYGVVARNSNDLLIFDSDSKEFSELLEEYLPNTLVVKSGGNNFGKHHYYRCDDHTSNTRWKKPKGSLRSGGDDGWFVVGPNSTHPDSENKYKVIEDECIAKIPSWKLRATVKGLDELRQKDSTEVSRNTEKIDQQQEDNNKTLSFIRRDDIRQEIIDVLKTNSDHDERVWMAGWLYSAAGLQKSEIVDIIMKEARWKDLEEDIVERQVESVINSSNNSRGVHYSNYSKG